MDMSMRMGLGTLASRKGGGVAPSPGAAILAWDDESSVEQIIQWDDEDGKPQYLEWDVD